jgi:4-hydroxy-tetrahydrodipicolinate synthase
MTQLFSGVGVALVTIFTADGEVDADATGKFAAELVDRGMRAVLAVGTTGEAPTLDAAERRAVIEAVRDAVPAGVPVIAGTGMPSARQAVALTRDAVAAGADAVLAWPPAGGPGQAAYFEAVAGAAAGRPVLAYHFPRVYPPGVSVEALAKLPVTGVKDSSGDADRLLDEIAHYQGATYTGSSALLLMAGQMGGHGALLALANIEPERCVAAFAGDAGAQLGLAEPHLAVKAGGPVELKRVLARTHGLSPACRFG